MIAGPWNIGCLKHLQDIVKDSTKMFAALEKFKTVFGGFEPDDIYPYAVDSVHFITGKFVQMYICFCNVFIYFLAVDKFRLNPSSKWFDFKSNNLGVKYEFMMTIHCRAIVWKKGQFPASENDITIF